MNKIKETLIACYAVLSDETIEANDKVSICTELMDVVLSSKERVDAIKNMEDNRESDLWREYNV